jgi:hypothetical protein
VLSPAAAWPFPKPGEQQRVERPTDDVLIEDQRAIARDEAKAMKAQR